MKNRINTILLLLTIVSLLVVTTIVLLNNLPNNEEEVTAISENTEDEIFSSLDISFKSNAPIRLGMTKEEVEGILGEGELDENLFLQYYNYDGLHVGYRENRAYYINIDSHPSALLDFTFDKISTGITVEELIGTYGEPFYKGNGYYEYFVYEREGKYQVIQTQELLTSELKNTSIDKTKLYAITFFTSFEMPDNIHKCTIQDYLFVEEQNNRIKKSIS